MPTISIIIAIYNRNDELFELLKSLSQQTDQDFETIIVDDGSQTDLLPTIELFRNHLDIQFYKKQNSGPGLTRNYGAKLAKGEWLVFVDSDVIVERDYISNIKTNIYAASCDAFGGADKAHRGFNLMQKAISYSMTSVFTTGGIRGSKRALNRFQPRSFNMGVRKKAFETVGGFSEMRIGEDPDLSMTLWEYGFKTVFFDNIAVYHKRRTDFSKFSRQVYRFGVARPILNSRHPQYVKISFAFPTFFLLGYVLGFAEYFLLDKHVVMLCYGFYTVLILSHTMIKTRNAGIAFLAVISTYIQLFSYGWGFLESWVKLNILKMKARDAFPGHFY